MRATTPLRTPIIALAPSLGTAFHFDHTSLWSEKELSTLENILEAVLSTPTEKQNK